MKNKMIFKIPIGNISKEQAEKALRELMRLYREDVKAHYRKISIQKIFDIKRES